jgi:predicted transcriptional regulator
MGKVENSVLDSLKEAGGEAYQSELVRQTGFSRSRVSEILSVLESNGLVSRFPLGKNFRVVSRTSSRGERYDGHKRREIKNGLRLGFIRAAEYPFVILFKRLLRENLGITLDLVIYENGINLARDLSLLRLDLGISPVITHFMYHAMGAPFKIIAPAGSGGSSIIVGSKNGRRNTKSSKLSVITTKLSTMELLLRSSINEDLLPGVGRVVYSSNPQEMVEEASSRRVDAACIWEPYATILLAKRPGDFTRLIRYNDIGEHTCCTLSAGNHLHDNLVRKLISLFTRSQSEYSKNIGALFGPYSALVGLDEKIVGQVAGEYSYPLELDPKMISKQFDIAGVRIPSPDSIKDAIRVAS